MVAIGVRSLVVLLVYRNPVAMLIPLIGIGMSLVIAPVDGRRAVGMDRPGRLNQAIILLSAMIAGAGTDYAVF